jgi:hypothetical protein
VSIDKDALANAEIPENMTTHDFVNTIYGISNPEDDESSPVIKLEDATSWLNDM